MSIFEEVLRQKLESNDRRATAKPKPPKNETGGRSVHLNIDPGFAASWTLAQLRHPGQDDVDLLENFSEIEKQIEAVKTGDLSGLEAILIEQVLVLNGIFTHYAVVGSKVLATGKSSTTPQVGRELLNLALRSQDQTRKTVLAIAELKNPQKTVFVKNQLNQMAIAPTDQDQQLQLREAHGEEVDTRAKGAAAAVNPDLETVEVFDRTPNHGRQAKKQSKRPASRVAG